MTKRAALAVAIIGTGVGGTEAAGYLGLHGIASARTTCDPTR